MEITFSAPKDVVVTPEVKKTIEKLTIIQMTDNPQNKIVTALIKEVGLVVIWKDEEYDSIGQWTDKDVIAKLKKIYK